MDDHAPKVFDFLDLNSYLSAYYTFRKAREKEFSYEVWAQELSFNRSRSFLRMVVLGKKKASPLFVEAFSRLNFASTREEEYFRFLVKYSQAQTQNDKQVFGQKLISILRSNNNLQEIKDSQAFISSPFLPRLFTMTSFNDIEPTIATFARLMTTSEAEVEEGLQKLLDLNLVQKEVVDGATHWKSKNSRFEVPADKGNMDLLKFHEKSLQEAIQAFHLPKRLRRYGSVLLSMSDEDLEALYRFLDDFSHEQLLRFSGDSYAGKRVYQMNFNVHSVTEPNA